MMQVVGLDPVLDERPHQLFERVDVVVHTPEQHRLANNRNTGIDEARDGVAASPRELPGMIGVNGYEGGCAISANRADELVTYAGRISEWNARMPTDHANMGNLRQSAGD